MNGAYLIRGLLILILFFPLYFRLRKNRQVKKVKEDFSNYPKDENGRYPWEVDTNDSATRIAENAKKFKEVNRINRGRW